MYVSHLGMQLFRALRANVGITCVDVTLRNVTGCAREKAYYDIIIYYSLCIHHVASLARGLHCIYVSLVIINSLHMVGLYIGFMNN